MGIVRLTPGSGPLLAKEQRKNPLNIDSKEPEPGDIQLKS